MINITYIYLIENIDNNPYKVYIGKSKHKTKRKSDHKITYGNQITYTVIDYINNIDKKYWKPLESYWIEQFKNWGYQVVNQNNGGGGCINHSSESKQKLSSKLKGRIISEDTRIKMSKSMRGIPKPDNFKHNVYLTHIGRKRSNETRKKQSDTRLGYKHSEETKQKMRKPKTESHCLNKSKPIIQYTLDGKFINEFPSQKIAGNSLNINNSDISACCVGKQKTAKGFIFKYKNS